MKKLTLLFGIIVSVLLWSCGGGSGKQEQSATSQVNEEETLYTREGMTKALTELDISIPEILKYDTILGNTIYFKTKGIDATTRDSSTDSIIESGKVLWLMDGMNRPTWAMDKTSGHP